MEYWRKHLSMALDSIDTASGALHYRLYGEGYELLKDKPTEKAAVLKAYQRFEAAKKELQAAAKETQGIDLRFN